MDRTELARFIDRWTIEYVRFFPHPIERVWRAITDPKEFGAWFIAGSIELEKGGAYVFGGEVPDFAGRLVAFDPPRLIRFGGEPRRVAGAEESWFQYELFEVEGGARMVFTQHFPPGLNYAQALDDNFLGSDLPVPGAPWKPGFVAGWHDIFDALRDHLAGVPIGSGLPASEFGAIARYWAQEHRRSGEFTAEQAERYARQLRVYENYDKLNTFYRAYIRERCPPADRTQEG